MYNLTDNQKAILRWIVQQIRDGQLSEEFFIAWLGSGRPRILGYSGEADKDTLAMMGPGMFDVLASNDLVLCTIRYGETGYEDGRRCTVTGKAFEAVDSDFDTPDTSFVRHLTPLADVTNLDTEIKQRCLPILGAGGIDPKMWDSVVRTAGVILEERLRDVGNIADRSRVGRELVNDVFGQSGTLAAHFSQDAERQGYRDMYAGMVGVFRNPYAHRLVDPTPEDGGSFVVFINLLLKMLEDLRDEA